MTLVKQHLIDPEIGIRCNTCEATCPVGTITLDFGQTPFPVLEGQSIGVLPPGLDVRGKPHHARQYSVASPRNGERPGYNNLSLTVKRVLEDITASRCEASPATICATWRCATRCR